MKKNKIKYLILAFLIPFIITLLVSYCKTFIFGGPKTALVSDMQGQYVSLFSYLQDVLKGDESLFYSFSKSLGGNMFGTFAYYLASPLNLILLFFSKAHLTWGILLLIMLKISLSGLTMYIYLRKSFDKDKMILLLFSTSYALIAYNVNYYFNIMWLDAIYLTPLLLLGIDKLIKGKSSLLYGIILFLGIITNYYIGYMLCILSCIYFVYKLFLNYDLKKDKEEIIKRIIKFVIVSFLAGVMTFFLLIPAIIELQNSQRAFGNLVSKDFAINFNIFDIFSRTYISSHNNANILSIETVSIYSGLITLPLVFFYFVNDKFKLKEKIADGILILIFILSIMIPHLTMIWHGMNFPNGFNYRFSFMLSFFLILIACKSFWEIKRIPLKTYLTFFIGYIVLSLITILMGYKYLNIVFVYISVACVAFYLVLLYQYGKEQKKIRLIKYLIILLVLSELFFNFFLSIRDYKVGYQNEFSGYMNELQPEIDKYKPNDNEFYRIEKNLSYTYIDSMLLDYNGVTLFLSTIIEDVISYFNNIGSNVRQVCIDYQNGTTPIMDSILGVKYQIVSNLEKPKYKLVDKFQFSKFTGLMYGMEQSTYDVFENPYALSLGFMVSDKIKDFAELFVDGKEYNNFGYQNAVLQTMLNSNKKYMSSYDVEVIDSYNFLVDIKNDKDFYIMVPFGNQVTKKAKTYIFLNDMLIKGYSVDDSGIFLVKNKYAGEKIKLTVIPTDQNIEAAFPMVYYLNDENFEQAMENLKANQLKIDKVEKNHVKGAVNATKEKPVLFTTIPYEKGWTIKVDGKKVDYYRAYDTFIALDLPEGSHDVELTFYPPGLKIGLYISFISALLFGLFIWKERNILNNLLKSYLKYEHIISYLIIGGLTTIVNFATYVVFAKVVGLDYITSSVIAWILAVLFAYATNKVFVFKSKTVDVKSFSIEMYRFIKYRILSLGIDLLIMFIMVEIIYANDIVAKILSQFVVVVLNYIFSKKFIFNKSEIDS